MNNTVHTLHRMTYDGPNGIRLVLRWRQCSIAAEVIERTWHPTQPDILPQDAITELVDGLAEYLHDNGWPVMATEKIARGFLGLNMRTTQ